MSVKEIEIAITQLPSADLVELMTWLENYHAEMWDKQIEEDLEAGRLDALLAEVDRGSPLARGLVQLGCEPQRNAILIFSYPAV